MSLQLYSNPMSRGRIARWMLEEIAEPYDVIYLPYGEGMRGADFLALNPMGKIPTLVHDGRVITETPAICAYLTDTFPAAGLQPLSEEKADYFRWMFFAAGPLEAATTNKNLGVDPGPDRESMLGYGSFDRMYETLVSALEGRRFICGDRFTGADVYVGASVDYGLRFTTLPDHPVLSAYRDRLHERPAYQRASQLDDAALNDANQTQN